MGDPDSIEYSVLGLLYDRPLHGYELFREYSDRAGLAVVWKVKRSRFYAILARLKRLGLIEMEVREQVNHPPRKVFRLTPPGLAAFRAWMAEPVSDSRSFRVGFPARFYFAHRIDPAFARRLVREQTEACRRWLEEKEAKASAARGFDALVLRFRAGQLRAMSEWLEDCGDFIGRESATGHINTEGRGNPLEDTLKLK